MKLSKEEYNRYSRHLSLSEVGEEGQKKLKAAKVLVVGAGGLGCPVLQYLAAAGVGHLAVMDMDVVEESNLQRQILYSVDDIGTNKAIAAKNRLQGMNPYIEIVAYPYALDTSNALELFEQYNLIVDGSDNFATRYLVNDACVILDKTLVYASIFQFEGQVAVFNYQGGPTYRCLFPEPPKPGEVPNCSEVGVLGVLPGIVGAMQANEALKIIVGIGVPLSGKLLVYQAKDASSMILNISKNPTIITATKAMKEAFKTTNYAHFCGVETETNRVAEISAKELAKNLEHYQIVDVRELWEQPKYDALSGINIPLPRLFVEAHKIPKDKAVVVICAKGIRSKIAIEQLQEKLGYSQLKNLRGGVKSWAKMLEG